MMLGGKTAIVTGAAQGIGAAIARELASHGATIGVVDVNASDVVCQAIGEAGGAAIGGVVDICDDDALRDFVQRVESEFGGIDILVNNAALFGTIPPANLDEICNDDWDRMMQVNTRGLWQCVKAVIPAMERRGGGSIINIATNRVFKGSPRMLHYDASKGAVIAMTKAMAVELGPKEIRVNAVAPGLTMSENVLAREGIADREKLVIDSRPLRRSQRPEDLAGVVAFFASDLSGFVTGQSLIVDGGGVMH